jgi:hypothetical protein
VVVLDATQLTVDVARLVLDEESSIEGAISFVVTYLSAIGLKGLKFLAITLRYQNLARQLLRGSFLGKFIK